VPGLDGPSCQSILLGYVGPGPGLEFVPYFLAMLAWAGAALGAMLLWPISALFRRFQKAPPEGNATSSLASQPEPPVEAHKENA
jgi:hypothetical protein